MTIGWSFIENFEDESKLYKNTSKTVSEQIKCSTNQKYVPTNTDKCVKCEDGTYQSAENHIREKCKIERDLILNGVNSLRPGQIREDFGLNMNSLDDCRQYVLNEKSKNNPYYDEKVLMIGHNTDDKNCWYVRNPSNSDRTVNAIHNTDNKYQMTCVDSNGNPIECNTSKENCNGLSNYYYSASDNLCKQHIPVNCEGDWGKWSSCDKTCGGGKQTRTFTVSRDAAHGGKSCSNSNGEVETKTCNIQPCPVNCEGDWGEWSKKCSKTCGGGELKRTFIVTKDAAHGGEPCLKNHGDVETRPCNTQPCPDPCEEGEWGEWSTTCSNTCGKGTLSRVFKFKNKKNSFLGTGGSFKLQSGVSLGSLGSFNLGNVNKKNYNSNKTCPPKIETKACSDYSECPVDCEGDWEKKWSECDKDCGGGKKTRTFIVTKDAAYGGEPCSKNHGDVETIPCNTQPCCKEGTYTKKYISTTYCNGYPGKPKGNARVIEYQHDHSESGACRKDSYRTTDLIKDRSRCRTNCKPNCSNYML